jgi:D-serine deaminase-like pyridoxal phosphate-dependent protein
MNIEELETPALVVDLDVLERNIDRMAEYGRQHNVAIRPHTKTHKVPAIARMQIDAGCNGITVAKPGEAEVMARSGLNDILVAYPIFGQEKWDKLARLAKDHTITVALDAEETARGLSRAAAGAGSQIGTLVEFDAGMHRCGVSSAAEVVQLAQLVDKLPGLHFRGVMFYPGHIWDRPSEQQPALGQVSEQLAGVLAQLRESGLNCEVVSGGSTPTALNSHMIPGVTEIRPGTYVFNDRNTVGVGACTLEDCALQVLVTVVSTAVPGRAMIDGGSKTFSSDRWKSGGGSTLGHIQGHPEFEFSSMSEEHGHLDLHDAAGRVHVGDKLWIIPNHVCACVNMHDVMYFHRNGNVEGCWPIEGRGKVR